MHINISYTIVWKMLMYEFFPKQKHLNILPPEAGRQVCQDVFCVLFFDFPEVVFADKYKAQYPLRRAPYHEREEYRGGDAEDFCGSWGVRKRGNAEIDDSPRIVEEYAKSVFKNALDKYDSPGLVQKKRKDDYLAHENRQEFSHKPHAIHLPQDLPSERFFFRYLLSRYVFHFLYEGRVLIQ